MRGTALKVLTLVIGSLAVSGALAQSKPQFKLLDATRYDFSAGYSNIRANAPPGECQCFDLNGGFVSGSVHLTDWLRIAGEFTGGHRDKISPLGQGLTLTTFTAGPQISHRFRRFRPYGEVLVGGAHGSDSYFPSQTSSSTSASSFAISTGGGLDYKLNPRVSVRAFDVQYLRTTFPNGMNNEQNQLMMGAGLVVKFYGRSRKPAPAQPVQAEVPPPPPPPRAPVVNLTCGTNVANVPLGQMVVITGSAKTEPAQLDLNYSWTSSGGSIEGSGNVVSISTAAMEVGDYQVKGHVALASDPSIGADCTAVFRVVPVEVPPTSTTTIVDIERNEKEFHEHVKDAFFALNSAKITPDTLATIIRAAQYLVQHPKIQVLISGWTDPRGTADYNIALGIRRANAVRNALIDAGVPPTQLEVISNGKSSQVCASKDQKCWQMNRRVSYNMKP
jgi:outer membrane protein OmpA-like peptidoglycan-associated protein/opacity protein-like surface antigen